MSTNATLRNNFAKRGSTVLCGNNNVNKEKEITQIPKKTTVTNQPLMNTSNSNYNPSNFPSNGINQLKCPIVNKIDNNKIKIKPRENNENDKNASNLYLKRKMTIEVENPKKHSFITNINNSSNNIIGLVANQNSQCKTLQEKDQFKITVKNTHENEVNTDMNISMKISGKKEALTTLNENTEMLTEEAFANGNNPLVNFESKTQRNPTNNIALDSKRASLPLTNENQFIAKSLLHGEIKKRPTGINGNADNINCEEFTNNLDTSSNITSTNPSNINNVVITTTTNVSTCSTAVNSNIQNKFNFKNLINGISINNTSTNQCSSINYSFNLENIAISKENLPKFTNEEYRRMFTRLVRKDFGRSFIQNLFAEEEQMDDFLINHKVTERMRTRMVDWMIEVLTNYKCDDNTFFIAINTMDRFFKAYFQNSLQPAELHLIGVTSMFMASKYEDIYPLRLKIVHEKIAHKKLSCAEIKGKESEISNNLGFILSKPTQWDFINHFIEEIFYTQINNFQVNDKTLNEHYGSAMGSANNTLMQKFSEYEVEIFKHYTPNMLNLLRHVLIYLAKMNCHDYILSTKKPSLIAASTIFVAMKICEQINKEEYVNEYFSKKLTEISQKNENEIIKTAQKILYNAQNFDTIFNGLENLKKIHFNAIIDLKNTK